VRNRKAKKRQKVNDVIAGTSKNINAPDILVIESIDMLRADYPGLIDKAVDYRTEANGSILIVNPFYSELENAVDYVYTNSGAINPKLGLSVNEELRESITNGLTIDVIRHAGITISSGLKRKTQATWSDDAIASSLSTESITIAIDYMWDDKTRMVNKYKKEVDSRIKLVKGSTSEDSALTKHEKEVDKMLREEVA